MCIFLDLNSQNIKSDASLSNLDARKTSLMPPPIKSIQSATATMPPPPPPPRLMDPPPRVPSRPLTPSFPVPPRSMAPPPPVPPRSLTPPPPMFKDTNSVPKKQSVEPLPGTFCKWFFFFFFFGVYGKPFLYHTRSLILY